MPEVQSDRTDNDDDPRGLRVPHSSNSSSRTFRNSFSIYMKLLMKRLYYWHTPLSICFILIYTLSPDDALNPIFKLLLLFVFIVPSSCISFYQLWNILLQNQGRRANTLPSQTSSRSRRNHSGVVVDIDGADGRRHHVRLPRTFAALDVNNLRLLLTDRDFTAEDYQTLLALDQNIPKHIYEAAGEGEIRRLPTHTLPQDYVPVLRKGSELTNNNYRNSDNHYCSICLESFQGGDVLRTLPCLHRFHIDCVDNWLRIKGECPICKVKTKHIVMYNI